MRGFSLQTRIYIIGSLLAGVILLGISLVRIDWQQNLIMIIILSLLASLALLFKVEGTTNRTHYDVTFLVYGFTVIAFGAPIAALVIFIAHIIEWIWHKYPWYIQTFNISSYITVAVFSNMVFEYINPTRDLHSWQGALAIFAAMFAFVLANHYMVGLIVWLARGENFIQSGIFQFFPVMLDWILLCMGGGAAVIWNFNPLATVLVLLPVYLIYSTLRVPSLERQTQTDPKTGLFNLKYFMGVFENELRRAERFNRPVTIVMADLDLLRNINNTYGHLAGDEVLIGVANILKNLCREFDVVARFGGEEFAIMMTETTPEQAYPLVEVMRKAVETAEFVVPTSDTPIKATMSFGVAGREPGLDARGIIHNADVTLYHAKLRGRNKAFTYTEKGYKQFPVTI